MILSEVIERIKFAALGAGDKPIDPRMLDSEVLIEIILPRCLQRITEEAAQDETRADALRADHIIALVAGVGTLPETISEKWAKSTVITSPDINGSYINDYQEYYLTRALACPTYTIKSKKLYYRAENTAANAYTGNVTINAVTIPTLPTLISDTVTLKDYLLEQLITLAACVVNGSIPLSRLTLDDINGKA